MIESSTPIPWKRWLALGLMATALGLMYFKTIQPRLGELRRAKLEVPSLEKRLAAADQTIKSLRGLEQEVAVARAQLRPAESGTGDPSSVWMREQLIEHFRRAGFPDAAVRLADTQDESESSGYQFFTWSTDIKLQQGSADLRRLLPAIASLETTKTAYKVTNLATLQDSENPGRYVAVVTVTALGPK